MIGSAKNRCRKCGKLPVDFVVYFIRHLIGIVANNGELTSQASLKGSHFVQLCSDRNVPILFFLNTVPLHQPATNLSQAKDLAMRLRAQASMMTTVACAAVPKINLVIGGCFGSESYAMCGRCFDPEFLFLWPNARVALTDGRSSFARFMEGDEAMYMSEFELKELEKHLTEESIAFYSSARLWDDGIILPQDSRKVITRCLNIIKQKWQQNMSFQHHQPILRF